MLDIKNIRENYQQVRDAVQNKNGNVENLDKILGLEDVRKKLIIQTEALRSRRNEIANKLKAGVDDDLVEESKVLKEKLSTLEKELNTVEEDWDKSLMQLPNLPLPHVPIGADETSNTVIRKVGKPTVLAFPPKDHVELGLNLDIIDVQRAGKVAGTRFAYLKKSGALLEFAILQFALKYLMAKGFEPVLPPAMIKRSITNGLGYWQGGGDQNYYVVTDQESYAEGLQAEDPFYLVGTGEHSVVPMHADETLTEKDLPKKYAAFSSCFRREAGSYGRDTQGILRVHQFDKLEMVAFVKPEDDERVRGEMLNAVEDMMQELRLPYQVVQLCTGDLSFPAAETIDIETWIPSQKKYRETHSISTTTDFQARRLNIRYQARDGRGYVHILNGTAFALGRIILAIMENYQQADGSIKVPEVLVPYTGFDVIKK